MLHVHSKAARHGRSSKSPGASSPSFTQQRQERLQGLTTQLLWRLQQSSPYHAKAKGDLVIPKLPEAISRPIKVGFADAMDTVFLIVSIVSLISLVLVLFWKEVPLRTKSAMQAAKDDAEDHHEPHGS